LTSGKEWIQKIDREPNHFQCGDPMPWQIVCSIQNDRQPSALAFDCTSISSEAVKFWAPLLLALAFAPERFHFWRLFGEIFRHKRGFPNATLSSDNDGFFSKTLL
jgi:hypothetical protein